MLKQFFFFMALLCFPLFGVSQNDGRIISGEEWNELLLQHKSDTLYLNDEFNSVTYIVSANDYFKELKNAFPDSITQSITSFMMAANGNSDKAGTGNHPIDSDYYLSMPFYDLSQALIFDHILHDLFVSGKLLLAKGTKRYTVREVRIRSKRVYCCHNPLLYCGKDWYVYHGGKRITTFSKSVTSKTYVMRSCF